VPAAVLAGRAASAGLVRVTYGLSPDDPATLGGASFLLAAIAVAAALWPARRVSGLDPVAVLRSE
jgi:ABC-type lipoprotein release transport system permease subunit